MRRQMITANTQYLGIVLLEPAVVPPERDGLLGSARGKIEYVKRQNDVFVSPVLAQGNVSLID